MGGLHKEPYKGRRTGSIIHWKPDDEVFTDIDVPGSYYKDVLRRQAVVNAGLTLNFTDEKEKDPATGKPWKESWCYEHGIADYVAETAGEDSLTPVFSCESEATGRDREDQPDYKVKMSAAFCFSNKVQLLEYYHNSSWLEHGGSPEHAVRTAFVYQINKYLKDKNLYKKGESAISFQDVQDCLVYVSSSFSTRTSYENQTKKAITNKFVSQAMTDFLKHYLEVYFLEKPDEAQKICQQVLVNKQSREHAEKTRQSIKKTLSTQIDLANRVQKFVDSKGNFGKAYSRDMSCAAARYTEAKLEGVCEELFRDIDKETVDFVPNYDGTTTEPTLLPVTFPTILANNTLGIAVGMACNICSFNLAELCSTTIALMKDAKHDISTTMPAPDFVGGGQILYDEAQMRDIFENGRGSVKVRARYAAVPGENMFEITQIPPTTTVEAIMDKIAELVKAGKIKEISDMRDETDLNGLKLTLDLKRGVDADKLMAKLFKATPLEDSFSCNFNILVSGQPRVMGVREILQEWTAFRMECVRRRTYYDLHGKEKRLHLLKGLAAILMDIDKAIHIIRTTEEETEVVPNLMIGFGIDEVQADYVAEIKLRHLNREYILKRTGEIEQLEADIADLNDILAKPARIRKIIMKELADVAKKYGQPRRSEILYDLPEEEGGAEEEAVPDYPVTVFFTREGYLKKIPPQSLRTAGAHKLKEGDEIVRQVETRNNVEALFFTDKQQVYKVRLAELEDGKVAQMGIYLPGRLGMDEGENILDMVITSDYGGYMLFFFASGKCAKIPLSSYATKQNRRKLLKAYCDKEPLATMFFLPEETELAIRTSAGRMLLVGTAQIAAKTTRDSQGVAVVTLKKNQTIASVVPADTLELANPHRYRVRSLPATGALVRAEDEGEQMTML